MPSGIVSIVTFMLKKQLSAEAREQRRVSGRICMRLADYCTQPDYGFIHIRPADNEDDPATPIRRIEVSADGYAGVLISITVHIFQTQEGQTGLLIRYHSTLPGYEDGPPLSVNDMVVERLLIHTKAAIKSFVDAYYEKSGIPRPATTP